MAIYRFSQGAEQDFEHIGDYTLRTWGEDHAFHYLASMTTTFERLAQFPALRHSCSDVRPGLRRMACGKHVIFYRVKSEGILISRILHHAMSPTSHGFLD